jgi:hypothetical protein
MVMNTEKNEVVKKLLYFAIVALIFSTIPKILQLNFISGGYATHLTFYPLFALLLYSVYCYKKDSIRLMNFSYFIKFIVIYLSILMITVVLGLYRYPYYQEILSGPIGQIDKLPMMLSFLGQNHIHIDEKIMISFWMIIRILKSTILEVFYTFTFSYIVFCWFHNYGQGLSITRKAIHVSLIIIILYSFFEILYLAGNENAKFILMQITPYIHEVKIDGLWWPPLLWKGQLRSVFAEPSYFGMYAAFAMPFLWQDILQSKKWKIVAAVTILFTFLLFLTKARTAFVLFLAESALLFVFALFLRKSFDWKKVVCIFLCSFIAFFGANIFINRHMSPQQTQKQQITFGETMTAYMDDNAKTITDPQKRSNGARFSVILANLKIGMEHPLFGVGNGLKNAYITDHLPDMAEDNQEVQMWKRNQREMGILKAGYPNLCEYATRFAETGIVGLAIFLFPMFFLIYCLGKKIKNTLPEKRMPYLMFLISFLGICATGFGDSITITYCYWILLGLGYALCFEKSDEC